MNEAIRLASAAGQHPAKRSSLLRFTRRTAVTGGLTIARSDVLRFGALAAFDGFIKSKLLLQA